MDFGIIRAHVSSVVAPLAHNPLPEDRGCQQPSFTIPRKRLDPADAVERHGYVPSITDNVKNECIGEHGLDQWKIKQMQRGAFGPTVHALFSSNRFHQDAEEVAGI